MRGSASVARLSRVDRKTVRRYVDAAIAAGVTADGGVGQLTDEVLGAVVEIVRPHRADGHHGEAWAALVARRDQIEAWVKADVAGVKICELLARDGVVVPERTVQRFVAGEFGPSPGAGLDGAGRMTANRAASCRSTSRSWACCTTPVTGRRRVCHALIFTAVFSRHMFVWLSFTQTTDDGDRRVRGGVAVLRRRVQGACPGQPDAGRDQGRRARATVQRGVRRVRPVTAGS